MRCNFLYINVLHDYPAADEQQGNRVTYCRIGSCAARQKRKRPEDSHLQAAEFRFCKL